MHFQCPEWHLRATVLLAEPGAPAECIKPSQLRSVRDQRTLSLPVPSAHASCLQPIAHLHPAPLPLQAYWLCASLASGALLKVRTIGLREGGLLLRLGDALIFFGPLHDTLGDTIADMLPVNVAVGGWGAWWGARRRCGGRVGVFAGGALVWRGGCCCDGCFLSHGSTWAC